MTPDEKKQLLDAAEEFVHKTIHPLHINNISKLVNPEEFNRNPFLENYLASAFGGQTKYELAKALIIPRALGTSITTSFGTSMQKFLVSSLKRTGACSGSASGIDFEFIDALDGRKKYCQLKSGPNTINHDDVTTISDHFQKVINILRTNGQHIPQSDMVVGVVYGDEQSLSACYKRLGTKYSVYPGSSFWMRVTGDKSFYIDLINTISSALSKYPLDRIISAATSDLAKNL